MTPKIITPKEAHGMIGSFNVNNDRPSVEIDEKLNDPWISIFTPSEFLMATHYLVTALDANARLSLRLLDKKVIDTKEFLQIWNTDTLNHMRMTFVKSFGIVRYDEKYGVSIDFPSEG